MDETQIAVTGVGAITPFGETIDEFADGLANGRVVREHISKIDTEAFRTSTGAVVHLDPSKYLAQDGLRTLDRASKLSAVAATLACEDAHIDTDEPSEHRAVSLGSTYPVLSAQGEFDRATLTDGPNWVSPRNFPYSVFNAQAGQIAIRCGAKGPNLTFASAGIASLEAISAGMRLIEQDRADVVLAGGVEVLSLDFFVMMEKMGLLGEDDSIRAPYHAESTGIVPAEGACLLVLESAERAQRRDREIYGYISGMTSCASSRNWNEPSGALTESIEELLERTDVSPEQIGWISGSGNGLAELDRHELSGISAALGESIEQTPLTSVKATLGEQMSAAGAFQVAGALLSFSDGRVPLLPAPGPGVHFEMPLIDRPERIESEFVLCTALSHRDVANTALVGNPN